MGLRNVFYIRIFQLHMENTHRMSVNFQRVKDYIFLRKFKLKINLKIVFKKCFLHMTLQIAYRKYICNLLKTFRVKKFFFLH